MSRVVAARSDDRGYYVAPGQFRVRPGMPTEGWEGGFRSVAFPWEVCGFRAQCSKREQSKAYRMGVELGWPKNPPITFSTVPWLWSCGPKVGVSVGMRQRPCIALQHCHQPSYDRAHIRLTNTRRASTAGEQLCRGPQRARRTDTKPALGSLRTPVGEHRALTGWALETAELESRTKARRVESGGGWSVGGFARGGLCAGDPSEGRERASHVARLRGRTWKAPERALAQARGGRWVGGDSEVGMVPDR